MISQSKLQQIYNESKHMRLAYLQLANRVEGLCEEVARMREFIVEIYNEQPEEKESSLRTKLEQEVGQWNG